LLQTWRWFGPHDIARIEDVVQAGAEGIVSALHHIQPGVVWSSDEIEKRKAEISRTSTGAPSGLCWTVVESLPISESIKKQQGDWRQQIEAYKQSLQNLADAGIETICYNFMPILDWTRTDLAWPRPSGATCMRFDFADFAAFDIHILERRGADNDFPEAVKEEAAKRFSEMDEERKKQLTGNIIAGLPGGAETFSLDDVRAHLAEYDDTPADRLRHNLFDFLEEVVPVAEKLGQRLCCHPDDPPFPLLGLPRIMSTEADYRALCSAVDSPANGITLCSGSLGTRPDNDLPGMMERLGGRVNFLHLRNVHREGDAIAGSFYEDEHLAGGTDMVALIAAVLKEEARRKAEGRADHQIPMRPDHGQDIVDDLRRRSQPGYPIIGRLRGLAELRGVITALSHARTEFS